MLEPSSRCIYLEELRPPVGYRLDRAVATTYSLDLLTLLMAPLSMALNECRNRDQVLRDPIAVLEALRQTTGRLTVFCQKGRIAVPAKDALLYRYLEPVVVEVQPNGSGGVFHAKTWLLRFVGEATDDPIFYRFLCLSRNLTFDRSWDTVLSLEGCVQDRQRAYGRNRGLSDFFAFLPKLAQRGITDRQRQDVALMADEVLRVKFAVPEEFDDEVEFLPLGVPGYHRVPDTRNAKRVLIVSPFLNDSRVLSLAAQGDDNVVISRPETLDMLAAETIETLEVNTTVFFLDDAADRPQEYGEAEADGSGESDVTQIEDFSGLHAKLYIVENGWYATVYSGSANATAAGMGGMNVELLVGVAGKKKRVGIDAFLGKEKDALSFRGMLHVYNRNDLVESDTIRRQLEEALEAGRRAITGAGFSVGIVPAGEGLYDLTISAALPLELPAGVEGRCFPISLVQADAQILVPGPLRFAGLSLASLTGFVAFTVTAEKKGRKASLGFVLNLPTSGMPAQREQRVLQEIIRDSSRFIRYLLLILAEDGEGLDSDMDPEPGGDGQAWRCASGIPLLEEMVRAFSRHPEKMARIQTLMDDLSDSAEGQTVLPEGFDDLWRAFKAARPGGATV